MRIGHRVPALLRRRSCSPCSSVDLGWWGKDDLPKKILPFKHVAEYKCVLHGDKNATKGECGEVYVDMLGG